MKTTVEYDDSTTVSGLPAPAGWIVIERRQDGLMWIPLYGEKISVIEDITVKADGKHWLHVSVGRANSKLPTYEDMQRVRKLFIGEHQEAYQVFPPASRYVNFDNVLHWWACLDAPEGVLPHFEGEVVVGGKKRLSI